MNRSIRILAATLAAAAFNVQGENFTVRATANNTFSPSQLTIEVGDSVTWVNSDTSGQYANPEPHNVTADNGSFRCAEGCGQGSAGDPSTAPWSFTRTFDSVGEIQYYCQNHGAPGGVGMSGTIIVEAGGGQPPPNSNFAINYGITGSWFDATKPDARQGFSLEVVPVANAPDLMVAYWFTYAPGNAATGGGVGTERWFQALGEIDGNTAVMDQALQCRGGIFDDPNAATCNDVGSVTAEFTSCTEGRIAYSLDLSGGDNEETTGSFPIVRLTPDVLCEEMASE